MSISRRYLGSFRCRSGNSCDVYLEAERLDCEWDESPRASWSAEDVEHYHRFVFPAIVRLASIATGRRPALGISL
jgi:hypothetical protein